MTHFILCSGLARSGKDTTAEIIRDNLEAKGYKVLITHYADLLKFICRNYFGWNGEKDEAGRTMLQYVGTDCVRNQNPDYWVDFVANFVRMFPNKWNFVIVSDVRFPNEIDRITDAGFTATHIRIVRPNFVSPLSEKQQQHPSETSLDNAQYDYLLINDGNLETLKQKVIKLTETLIKGDSV